MCIGASCFGLIRDLNSIDCLLIVITARYWYGIRRMKDKPHMHRTFLPPLFRIFIATTIIRSIRQKNCCGEELIDCNSNCSFVLVIENQFYIDQISQSALQFTNPSPRFPVKKIKGTRRHSHLRKDSTRLLATN
jgi:hypothetical protein